MKIGKDIHTVGNKSSTGCVNPLCLGEEVFEPLGPFLCGFVGGGVAVELPS